MQQAMQRMGQGTGAEVGGGGWSERFIPGGGGEMDQDALEANKFDPFLWCTLES